MCTVLYIKSEYSENRRCRLRAHLFRALLAKRILTLRCSCKSGPTYHGDFSSGIHRGVTDDFTLIVWIWRTIKYFSQNGLINNFKHLSAMFYMLHVPSSIKCSSSSQIALNQMLLLIVQMYCILLAHDLFLSLGGGFKCLLNCT